MGLGFLLKNFKFLYYVTFFFLIWGDKTSKRQTNKLKIVRGWLLNWHKVMAVRLSPVHAVSAELSGFRPIYRASAADWPLELPRLSSRSRVPPSICFGMFPFYEKEFFTNMAGGRKIENGKSRPAPVVWKSRQVGTVLI